MATHTHTYFGMTAKPCTTEHCQGKRAYRGLSDMGEDMSCWNKPNGPSGVYCKRHDPATMPKRDARGHILPTEVK